MHVITPFKINTPHGIVFSSHPETKESAKSYEAYYHKKILPMKILLDSINAKILKEKQNQKIKK
jgi:hypothetical protein